MGSDVMRVRLGLRQVRVLGVVLDTPFELVVEVESSVHRPRCPDCGSGCSGVHDVRVKRVRDLGVSGRPAVLLWRRRRLVCGGCDRRFLERHPAFEGGVTARLARRLVADARCMPISRVARRRRVGWHQVNGLVRAWSELVAERRRSRRCRVLLVDETSIRRRHRYVTVVVNADTGRTLAMVPHRSTAALAGFLARQGHKWCKQVKVVVTDGSPAYKAAIDARLGHAEHVLDRFHVIRWFSAGLTAPQRPAPRPRSRRAGVRPRSVQGPVLAAATTRLTHRSRQKPPRSAIRRPPEAPHRLASPPGTTGPLRGRRPQRRPRSPRPAQRPPPHRPDPRIPRHRQRHHRMVRRDTRLAPHRPPLKRPNRRHQQPPPSPQTHRTRLHQPRQLPSQRPPDNTTRSPTPTDPNPTLTRRALFF